MDQKYYVGRRWIISGREEFQMHKCLSRTTDFCDSGYIKRYPDRVWQFSKQGAKNIVERRNAAEWNKNCEYFMIPVETVLGSEANMSMVAD